MKQLSMINTSLGLGKRCPKQTQDPAIPKNIHASITKAPHPDR